MVNIIVGLVFWFLGEGKVLEIRVNDSKGEFGGFFGMFGLFLDFIWR